MAVSHSGRVETGLVSPGADVETRYEALQERLRRNFREVFPDQNAERTVVIIPSLSLDADVLAKITGVHHYEERMLCLLLLLRMPRTRVVYMSSTPIAEPIIDYYLHLLPGIPAQHARRRLRLLSCDDSSSRPLTQKILERPRMLERMNEAVHEPATAHMTCFTVTELERELSLKLDIPIYGCDPALAHWGSKSGSRRIFREAGIDLPTGAEDLRDAADVADAVTALKTDIPDLRKAVVKLNEGFSGEGNAVFDLGGAPAGGGLRRWVGDNLPNLAFEHTEMTWGLFEPKLELMQGIVEEFVEGEDKRSPSSQFRIDPLGTVEAVSTHDQVLGGAHGQIFHGCRFPADTDYCLDIQEQGRRAAAALSEHGVRGRLGVDFISVRRGTGWRHYAIELNIRKGGTTHPFLMLQFLTDGSYDETTGQFLTAGGRPCCYYASDNLESDLYRGLTPHDLVDISAMNRLHFHAARQEGVVFHLIGALSEFGKLGIVCIGGPTKRPGRSTTVRWRCWKGRSSGPVRGFPERDARAVQSRPAGEASKTCGAMVSTAAASSS